MTRGRVTVVVVAYDGGPLLADCVDAVLASSREPPTVVLVDNASRDGVPERIARRYPRRLHLVSQGANRGFAGGVNAGLARVAAEASAGDVSVLVNQDCLIAPGSLDVLAERLHSLADIAVVGGCLLEPDGRTLQHAGGCIHRNGLTDHIGRGRAAETAADGPTEVDYVTGALFAFRMITWRRFGPFDEAYHPVYFEDVDFCVRVRAAGLRVVYEPCAVAVHHEASSSGRGSRRFLARYHRSRMRFVARHSIPTHGWFRVLGAETKWLARQRAIDEIAPALRAYMSFPAECIAARGRDKPHVGRG